MSALPSSGREFSAGKTTLLRCLMNEVSLDSGEIKWAEMANIAYFAQDHAADFAEDMNLFDWMKQWTKGDEQLVLDAGPLVVFAG